MKVQINQLINYAETGMGFQILKSDVGFLAALTDGTALSLSLIKDIAELVDGEISLEDQLTDLIIDEVFSNRSIAINALMAGSVSTAYTGLAGAIPLIKSYTLISDTIFYRIISSAKDIRFKVATGELLAGTYLTTELDYTYSNSGFASVGRFALPIPLAACNVIQYKIPAGTLIKAGTVSPMFGQAGGGVEINLVNNTIVNVIGSFSIPEY